MQRHDGKSSLGSPVGPRRTVTIEKLEQAEEKTLDNPALTQAGLTAKNVLLLHANGALGTQLPAIYQNIEAQPRYSEQLFRILKYLARLQPLTPGMDQMAFYRLVGSTLAQWPQDKSASKDAIRSFSLIPYPADADPRPAYDALNAGEPYTANLHAETLMRFKAHGHADIFEAAVAASKPVENIPSLRYSLARLEIEDLAIAGDWPAALAKLDAVPFITRYYIIGHSLQDNSSLPQATRDAFRTQLLQKYPYELTAFELGWRKDLGVPTQLKLDTIIANYEKITDFLGKSPADWLMGAFGVLTPAQRMQALKAMHQANDKLWPLYASAVAIVDRE